jgi:cytochrome P450
VLILKYSNPKENGLPPGPPSLPIIGSLPFLGDMDIRKAFVRMTNKYGTIFSIRLGLPTAVVLSGYDVITDAFLRNGKSFSDRPKSYLADQLIGSRGKFYNIAFLFKL